MADQFSKMYDFERVGGDQRTRLAEMLRANALNAPQGQMVSGWYVPPSWSQNLNTALSGALGTYMGVKLDDERKQQIADLIRKRKEGVAVEPTPTIQNFNQLEGMAEGQTPFSQQEPQNQLQRLTQMPQSTERSVMNPAMMPQQQQRFRPMTQDELDENMMQMYQADPRMASLLSGMETSRAARAEAKALKEEQRAWQSEENKLNRQAREDQIRMMASLRPGPQPQAPVAVIDPSTGQEVFVAPSQAYGMRPAKSMQPLSAAQQKEVLEADETIQSSQNVINTLNQALKINPQAYSGYGAKGRAILRSNLPGESAAADATINLENMMSGQALESLKSTFGGNPTEGERKILLDLQASADKTPKQREEIITRAIAAAENRMRFNMQKAEALRGGTYMRPGYSPVTSQLQQTGGMPSQSAIDAEIARRQGR